MPGDFHEIAAWIDSHPIFTGLNREQIHAAMRTVCDHTDNTDDCRELLEMLGLL